MITFSKIKFCPTKQNVEVFLTGCNLECRGFSRTIKNPIPKANILSILPIEKYKPEDFDVGCDSAFSWDKRFKSIWTTLSARDIVSRILDSIPSNGFNKSVNPIGLTFTGGEPLLPENQQQIAEILNSLSAAGENPLRICFETNGTCSVGDDLWFALSHFQNSFVSFTISPKLRSVSGEEAGIVPEVIRSMVDLQNITTIDFLFIVDGTEKCFEELNAATELYMREFDKLNSNSSVIYCVTFSVSPVGSTFKQQNKNSAAVLELAKKYGYFFAPRIFPTTEDIL